MDPAQALINQYAEQATEERAKPPAVLEDTINEGKEYEKSLLQGVGGLVAGSSVEKGFKQLANSKKGAEALKKLGMSDEDVEQVISAIKGRDASSLSEFLARKGTGYVKNLGKELGGKAKGVLTKLKKGQVPTRQDLQDAINRGGGDSVNPTASNRSSSNALADADEEDGLGVFDKLISKGRNAIKGTTKALEDKVGDIPAKLSKQASRIGNDTRDIVRGAEPSASNVSKPQSVFDRARAEFQGDDDLSGQSEAVRKLLSNSKKGRRLLRQNAKDKVEGKKPIRQKKQQKTEFDDEDEEGDLLKSFTNKTRGKPVDDDLFGKSNATQLQDARDAQELNPFTNEPIATPQQKADLLKSKADDELKQATDQLANEGDRDPYQDVYDNARMTSERFTPKQPTGEPMKKDLDLKFKAPTEEEAKAQAQLQEQAKPETNKTSFDDVDKTPVSQDVLDDLPDLKVEDAVSGITKSVPTASVPPSQQTGGLDPSTLPDDAGFQRGSAKIQAKKEVDAPKSDLDLITDEEASSLFKPVDTDAPPAPAGTGKLVPPKPEPNLPPNDLQPSSTIDTEAIRTQTTLDADAVKQGRNIPIGGGAGKPQFQDPLPYDEEPKPPPPPTNEAPKPPPSNEPPAPPKPQPKPDIPDDPLPDIPPVNPDTAEDGANVVKKGLTKAFEDSLEGDEDPFGVVLSGVLGIGALIAGAFGKAHHPHFVQPPTTAPYESYSVQEGVA